MSAKGRIAVGLVLVAACCAPVRAAADPEVSLAATDEFTYSYNSTSRQEIVENWLDATLLRGDIRAGALLDHQAPSEEGFRSNAVRHRFLALAKPGLELRIGQFYGMFGRGLLFAAREDRQLRVDTWLDGVVASGRHRALRGTVFSGTPSALSRDVRGADAEVGLGERWSLGGSGLTWRADDGVRLDGSIRREWVAAPRLTATLPFGGVYVEYGWKKGWDFVPFADDAFQSGHAFYGSVQLFRGPLALVAEAKDYRRFTVLRAADGRTPLNEPPSLTREHLYTLLNRAPHAVDADDEHGQHVELSWAGSTGWAALLDGSRTDRHDGTRVFEEAYAQVEGERVGPFHVRAGLDYRESEGLRQAAVGEITWLLGSGRSVLVEAEHQHVRVGGGTGFDLGAYDEEYVKIQWDSAPAWSAAMMLEINDKYPAQRAFGEKAGPFPAAQLAYSNSEGARISIWAGRRQAGYLCAGGVCRYEPAFEGVELTGTVRY